jgi:electron transfer flavoprotein beta subunit
MEVLTCIKRVPDTGAKIPLTDDEQSIETSGLGFTVSPHEECAVEEAVQIVEEHGGSATALTLGPDEATEQLYTMVARGVDEAMLLAAGDEEWRPTEVAGAIANVVREKQEEGDGFDLLLFGNEAADTGDYQVPIRVAHELGVPCVTSIKGLELTDDGAIAKREIPGGEEVYELPMPAVVAVKEGINSPRYASMRSRMQAQKTEIAELEPEREPGNGRFEKVRLEAPETDDSPAEVLGDGPDAAPKVVDVLKDVGVL